MRLDPFQIMALLLVTSCQGPPSTTPTFASREGAAAYAVLHQRDRSEHGTVVVNIPPGQEISESAIRADLRSLMDSVKVWRSDSLYGGAKRHAALTSQEYLILDIRPQGHSGKDSLTLRVSEERCAGWPCRAAQLVTVRQTPTGFLPGAPQRLSVE